MFIFKLFLYVLTIATSSTLGVMLSQKYVKRVDELKAFKSALVMLKTKIRYTYAPICEIFTDISKSLKGNVSTLFKNACVQIEEKGATDGFYAAVEMTVLNVTKEDRQVMGTLSKLLGKTDAEGQINEIELVQSFLETQIEKAEVQREKNAKLYKTLGVICGIGIVIILL